MISIVVPVYNGENHIDKIVHDLNSQTYKDFEVIFIDDGSTDRTHEVIRSLPASHSYPIHILYQENSGVSAARNAGLRRVQGEYICFVDVDDRICADYLLSLYRAITESGCSIALGHITRSMKEWTTACDHSKPTIHTKDEFLREYLYRGSQYSLCACIFRTDALRSLGLTFKEGYRYSEDVHLLWRFIARQDSVAVIHKPIYFYTDNPYSAMRRMDVNRIDAIRLMEELEIYMDQFAPEFSPEFRKYAVARHHWSILWQAAMFFDKYGDFHQYYLHFAMKDNMRKLYYYPDMRVSVSARIFNVSNYIYFVLIRLYRIIC